MENKNLICIVCPVGCSLKVCTDGNDIVSITGNSCKRGEAYAVAECTNPTRTLTSTVKLKGGQFLMAPVKSDKPIPKALIFECMKSINQCCVNAPVKVGDVVIANILNTGVNIIATGNVKGTGTLQKSRN